MKSKKIAIMAMVFVFLGTLSAQATTLFFDDFEDTLSQWTGGSLAGRLPSGEIVTDPKNQNNSALNFKRLGSSGDIFTIGNFLSTTGDYILSFNYLGFHPVSGNSGGFIGAVDGTIKGSNFKWLYSTEYSYTGPNSLLPDDGEWNHYSIQFSAKDSVTLVLQDWQGSGGVPGDAYFDNIILTDLGGPSHTDPTAPVPEPATLALLGTGLIGMALYGRKKKMLTN